VPLADTVFTQLAFKASHNSYSVPPVRAHLDWSAEVRYRGGCRGLELDVRQKEDGWEWAVRHEGPWIDEPAVQLKDYLKGIVKWSADRDGDHDVIMVHINLKDSRLSHTQFPAEFDRYVSRAIGDAEVFTPGELLGGEPNLLTASLQHGWPTLGDLYGKFIFCLTGAQEDRTKRYTDTNTANRLCFCDWEVPDPTKPELPNWEYPNRVIYNFAPFYHRRDWVEAMAGVPDRDAFLIRAYDVNDKETWDYTRTAGVNILATDQVFKTPWAYLGDDLFAPRSADFPRVTGIVAATRRAGLTADLVSPELFADEELTSEELQIELHRVRHENRMLREEREILTRAVAVLARQATP
jgi:hypothetical protein